MLCLLVQWDSGAELVTALLSCDIIIYHVTETASQVEEASSLIQGKVNSPR